MSNPVIKAISSLCPTTLEELKSVDGLGEQKVKEYGERLVKNISNFVQTENLEELLAQKKSSRPMKARKVATDEDEFGADFNENDLMDIA